MWRTGAVSGPDRLLAIRKIFERSGLCGPVLGLGAGSSSPSARLQLHPYSYELCYSFDAIPLGIRFLVCSSHYLNSLGVPCPSHKFRKFFTT
ncbi:unnamed protein product [Bursaphelenchus xylophilus]|uniref:(pine wood nematode) hypothetical protein n=1 Tax=Bursaphelenchus xylophilus TaxID=6326 RepID=A0A1I7SRW7_BURXY|nr:unnamed protein product [Bursaphelenchus xylophilus]CAG9101771.1 unnamed protein product [Bursaphelenchus xylophilus]